MKIVEHYSLVSAPGIAGRWLLPLAIGLALAVATSARAATESVRLAWDPSPDPTVKGYYVYYGTASHAYSGHVDSQGGTVATVAGLVPEQTYFFAVSAYNDQQFESALSEEVAYVVPSPIQAPLRLNRGGGSQVPTLQFRVNPKHPYDVEASEDLRSWRTIYRNVSLTTNWISYVDSQAASVPRRFYRLALPNTPQVPGWIDLVPGALPSGAVRLRPLVAPGQHYQIQASSDFQTWTCLHEGVGVTSQPLDFVDLQAGLYVPRFYRLALLGTVSASGLLQTIGGDTSSAPRLRVSALQGQHYRVEASLDLNAWQTIGEGVAISTDPADLVDPQARQYPSRYYRLAFD